MANEPTMQNTRMIGIRIRLGIDRMVRAPWIASQPSGSIRMLARKNTMKIA